MLGEPVDPEDKRRRASDGPSVRRLVARTRLTPNRRIDSSPALMQRQGGLCRSIMYNGSVITHGVVLISRRSAGAAGAQWLLRRVVKADSVLA